MAFVVEDGSGKNDATSYVSEAYAVSYHTDRGNTAWTAASSAAQQTALINATTYVDARFGTRFRGKRLSKDQALEWPRIDANDDDGYGYSGDDIVPRKLQQAVAEYALRSLTAALAPDPDSDSVNGQLTSLVDKVGPVTKQRDYKAAATGDRGTADVPGSMLPAYPLADLMMVELLRPRGSGNLYRG